MFTKHRVPWKEFSFIIYKLYAHGSCVRVKCIQMARNATRVLIVGFNKIAILFSFVRFLYL